MWLKGRDLSGVELITGDKAFGMVEAIGEVFPKAKYQRYTVHFYRNVFSVVLNGRIKEIAKMLKVIHAQEDKQTALKKADAIVEKLCGMKLQKAAQKVEDGILER